MADSDVEVSFGAQIEGLLAGVEGTKEALQGIVAPLNQLKSAFTEMAEVVAVAFGVEKIVRDLRVHQILEGTNEIMRLIVARSLVGR